MAFVKVFILFWVVVHSQTDCTSTKSECYIPNGNNKVDCGYGGITEAECEQKGCCWCPINPNPGNEPWCFYKTTLVPTQPTLPTLTPAPTKYDCDLQGCSIYNGIYYRFIYLHICTYIFVSKLYCYTVNQCSGEQINTSATFDDWRWYTPPRNTENWLESYQDYAVLVGYATIIYSNNLTTATVSINALHKDSSVVLSYVFGGVSQSSNTKIFSSQDTTKYVSISITGNDGSKITLDPIDFHWNAPDILPRNGDYRNGQKGGIVEFFGWPHNDIEQECQFLADNGYLGAKVFPPQEQVMSYQPFNQIMNPWYFMYQPVSYRLQGRMGSRDDLRNLIYTCRQLGVRVYADAVINHMTGGGNDMNIQHRNPNAGCSTWPNKTSSLELHNNLTGSSPFYNQDFIFQCSNVTGFPSSQEYPAAMYGPLDFHCERALNSWNDPTDLNAGWLEGLVDLNTERDNVRERIAAYLTDLISIGFSGFRIDAAKHIEPDDIVAIFVKLKRNMGGTLPNDFITWLEILLGGESDLLMCNPDSGYNYGIYLQNELLSNGFTMEDVNKIKIWNSGYPKEPELGYCTINNTRNAVQNDDADQQTPGSTSRDMGDQGCVLIENCNSDDEHMNFETKLFNNPNGVNDNNNGYPIRLILSSFWWPQDNDYSIPDGYSNCDRCTTTCDGCLGTNYTKAHDPTSNGYDKPGYTRVHRNPQIIGAMKNWLGISNNTSIYMDKHNDALMKARKHWKMRYNIIDKKSIK